MNQSSERIKILIIDDIAETRENLRKLLSFEPDIEVIGAAGSGSEGIELAKQYDPHIVLMDINMPGMDGITATRKLLEETPTAQVVMLSVQGETDYLRRAMLAGARDFLTKPASGDELLSTIHRVYEMGKNQRTVKKVEPTVLEKDLQEKERDVEKGEVVAVFAPKGGVGCTTIAVNLAVALQQIMGSQQKVGLLDANLQFGDVGVMLNLHATRSMGDLAPRLNELDRDMLSSVMTAHGSGIKALLAPPRPEEAEGLLTTIPADGGQEETTALGTILDLMRADFDIVVVDMWSWLEDIALTLLDVASLILIVVTPDIPAIKSARLFLEVARKLDYPTECMALVVNSADRRGSVQVEQIEKALMPTIAQIPFDQRLALTAANRGIPFITQDRSRPISEAILELAKSVREEVLEVAEEEAPEETESEDVGGTGFLRLRRALGQR